MKRRPAKPARQGSESGVSRAWEEVRPERVERARKLVADPDYPSKEVTEAVAELLAKHLRKER